MVGLPKRLCAIQRENIKIAKNAKIAKIEKLTNGLSQ